MREAITTHLTAMSDSNNHRLEEIRKTVDEKLQESIEERMNRSFRRVSESLEEVYKGIGEMKTLASDVGSLKKVLSNVKTRGIMGEIQLGAILSEILAPEQYDTDIATIPQSPNRVEYAIKLPGDDGGHVYLPVDSKFPADCYLALQEAQESGNREAIDAAASVLISRIKSFAKDIKTKYVEVPYTTSFAIMFLPFEGLYSEVVSRGLVEILQRDYSVNIAGPSTMAALLNSLQMGFKTLAIQKRSDEVWQVLSAVKSEFEKFEEVLASAQKHIDLVGKDIDKLVGVRTRAIHRRLRDVQSLESDEQAKKLLDYTDI
ncbi:MAG: DNA recombination protein RmuC [Oscillospiraceae bacterium]|nr:DNA recombination protein RmuC [Oscillospiraceae bacterium]